MRLTDDAVAELAGLAADCVAGHGDVLCAFVGGSVAEGYATSTSDIDLVVIPRSAAAARQEAPGVSITLGSGARRVDVELISARAYLDALCPHMAGRNGAVATDCACDDLATDKLNSLRVGLPVTGHAAFDELRRTIPWPAVRRHLARSLLQAVLESIEDARGAIADRRVYPARYCSRLALDLAVDHLTVRLGDLNTKPKWRAHRIERLGLTDLGDRYLRADVETSFDDREALAAAEARLDLTRHVLSLPADGEVDTA